MDNRANLVGLRCPEPDCGLVFETLGGLVAHAYESHTQKKEAGLHELAGEDGGVGYARCPLSRCEELFLGLSDAIVHADSHHLPGIGAEKLSQAVRRGSLVERFLLIRAILDANWRNVPQKSEAQRQKDKERRQRRKQAKKKAKEDASCSSAAHQPDTDDDHLAALENPSPSLVASPENLPPTATLTVSDHQTTQHLHLTPQVPQVDGSPSAFGNLSLSNQNVPTAAQEVKHEGPVTSSHSLQRPMPKESPCMPMIGYKQTGALCLLLKNSEKRPFEEIITDFTSTFPRSVHPHVCHTLSILLEDLPELLEPTERLVAFALLHHTYSSLQLSTNPYLCLLINIASDEKTGIAERAFIINLLSNSVSLELSAGEFIKSFDTSSNSFPTRDELQQQYCHNTETHQPFTCFFKNAAIKNVIPDPYVPRWCDANSSESDLQLPGVEPKSGSSDREQLLEGVVHNLSWEGLYPRWTRPCPPRLPVLEGELVWVNPSGTPNPQWDVWGVFDLFEKAMVGPLAPPQQNKLINWLRSEPEFVSIYVLTARQLLGLVKNNPKIAAQYLANLVISSDKNLEAFFTAFCCMDTSRSLDVAKQIKLTTGVVLPSEFVRKYITKCISSCTKGNKNQLVRDFCDVLKRWIKNKMIKLEDVDQTEVQAFIIEFTGIREAEALSTTLKGKGKGIAIA